MPKPSNKLIAERRLAIKLLLATQNGLQCGYCFKRFKKVNQLTIDHIQPLSKGGADKPFNMMLACKKCNELKGCMEIEEWLGLLGWEVDN